MLVTNGNVDVYTSEFLGPESQYGVVWALTCHIERSQFSPTSPASARIPAGSNHQSREIARIPAGSNHLRQKALRPGAHSAQPKLGQRQSHA